ncbi:penicillin-binding protein activator [Endozoicomonas sp. SCSIO W0465]|uniref:penicillin-binding protein activator n=1 Tax=Endozoicomonas sp. SCSIO W0465 TaxID=2918516 RepID=UPI0020762341|nr:penicillin-binding protein activator [Endozoicomonas sp. SCSIO W0465]USE34890.1 penicillin-binding protein activator [Endozoicomonas sp. SCSIO W0465]
MMTHTTALRNTLPRQLAAITLAGLMPVLITACSSQPKPTPAPIVKPVKSIDQQLADAERFSYPKRASLILELTRELISKEPARTQKILDQMPYEQLPRQIQAELAVQQAQIAQINNQDWAVFDWLDREAVIISNSSYINSRAHILKALAYARYGEYQASLDEWLLAGPYLTEAEREPHYDSFWQTLLHVPAERLDSLYNQEKSQKLKGWLALALIYQSGRSLDQQLTGLEQWKRDWLYHPAHKYLPVDFETLKSSSTRRPDKIAVLLPLSGRLSKVGEAVRDGMLASHYEAMSKGEPLPELQFYNTQSTNINDLATQAIEEGAQLIIGPLNKSRVKALNTDTIHRIPVLALNYIDDAAKPLPVNELPATPTSYRGGLYQFGLSAEDEAIMAAERGRLDGHRTAIIITPNTEWGKKINTTFKARWEELGGEIAGSGEFDTKTQFSSLAGWLLHTDQSEARAKQLNRVLGEKLGFQARRRQDVDMVFIGANPQDARQIKPALAYQYAGSVPVYATSSAFSGITNTTQDQDRDGIRVPVMPWLIPGAPSPLEQQINTLWQQSRGQLGALYALGADAYKLYPRLQQLSSLQGSQLQGMTGSLSIAPDGKVHRELSWQLFRNGQLTPLPIVKPKTPENELSLQNRAIKPLTTDTSALYALETQPD